MSSWFKIRGLAPTRIVSIVALSILSLSAMKPAKAEEQSGASSVEQTALLVEEINRLYRLQDWSRYFPFWFKDEKPSGTAGTVSWMTVVGVSDGQLRIFYADHLRYFDQRAAAKGRHENEVFINYITVPQLPLSTVSPVVETTLPSLNSDTATLAEITAAPQRFQLRPLKAFEFTVTCPEKKSCLPVAHSAFSQRNQSTTTLTPSSESWEVIYFMAPTRDEAEKLRAAVVALMTTLGSK